METEGARRGAGVVTKVAIDHAARDGVTDPHARRREVRVHRHEAGPVVDLHDVPVARVLREPADRYDRPVGRRAHPRGPEDGDVEAGMEPAPAIAEARLEGPPERHGELLRLGDGRAAERIVEILRRRRVEA